MRRSGAAQLLFWQLLVGVVLVGIWHVGSTIPIAGVYLLPKFFFSTPTDVALRIFKMIATGEVWRHIGITLTEAVLSFVIGSIGGVLIGFWFARKPFVSAVFGPYLQILNALPRVVLAATLVAAIAALAWVIS